MTSFQVIEDYSHLHEMILKLVHHTTGKVSVIQNNRNIIEKIETDHGSFVVKDFQGMYLPNRLAYSAFRKSKAIRSYENSLRLNSMGIHTPPPVAWFDIYSWGLLSRSIFISEYYDYPTLQEFIRDNEGRNEFSKPELLHAVAGFAYRLHQLGILHDDFSWGNIFVVSHHEGYEFGLTDLNRMRFRKSVSYVEALSNLRKIQLEPGDREILISNYARIAGRSTQEALTLYNRLRNRSSMIRRARRKIRKYTVGLLNGNLTH